MYEDGIVSCVILISSTMAHKEVVTVQVINSSLTVYNLPRFMLQLSLIRDSIEISHQV